MTHGLAMKILLVDDDSQARSFRALMLLTHGYTVETVGSLADLDHPWEEARYDLVLLCLGSNMRCEVGSWKRIQREYPRQEFMFVLNGSERLCPLFLDGKQVRDEEGSDSFLQRVEAALSPF